MQKELLVSSGSVVYTGSRFSGVYGHQCHATSKWYIGESKNVTGRGSSYYTHIHEKQRLISASFSKHGTENFSTYILERCPVDLLHERELYWSIELNSISPDGYNLKVGGHGKSMCSDETRERMSVTKKGVIPWNKGKKGAQTAWNKGIFGIIKATELTREKQSKSMTGKVFSDEHRSNISRSAKKRPPVSEKVKSTISDTNMRVMNTPEMRVKVQNGRKLARIIKWLENEAPWFCAISMEKI